MSWKEILKSPVFVGEDFEQPENKEGDNFEWLNKFNVNDTNVNTRCYLEGPTNPPNSILGTFLFL